MKKHLLPFLVFCLVITSCVTNKNNLKNSSLDLSTKENLHLYILMGQSNMAGRGKIEALDTLTHPRVLMLTKEMNWEIAKDPLHFDKSAAGAGLGLTFGKILANDNPNIEIGLIPTAVGGSSINYWFADSLFHQTNTHPYNDMVSRTKKAMEKGTLKGILWHQGESDSNTEEDIASYKQKFEAMLNSLYSDLEIESIPIVMGELGYFFYPKATYAKEMNKIIGEIANDTECIELVSAEDLTHKGDETHFDTDSYHALGVRYAAKMLALQINCSTLPKR